jgi:hypothetical protein
VDGLAVSRVEGYHDLTKIVEWNKTIFIRWDKFSTTTIRPSHEAPPDARDAGE